MITTNIYGLFDPRAPDVIIYVGKGLAKRAAHHWPEFVKKGTAENALLRRKFEGMCEAGIEPEWRFIEEGVADWEEAERRLIAHWRKINPELCNVADGGNSWPAWSGRIGGQIGGRRVHELYPELMLEASRRGGYNGSHESKVLGGSIGGRATNKTTGGRKSNGPKKSHELHPELAKRCGYRTNELHPGLHSKTMSCTNAKYSGTLEQKHWCQKGAFSTCHNRWHVKRDKPNPECPYYRNVDFINIWENQACYQS